MPKSAPLRSWGSSLLRDPQVQNSCKVIDFAIIINKIKFKFKGKIMNFIKLIAASIFLLILSACGASNPAPSVNISAARLDCPTGSVVTGVNVRIGEIIDNLGIRCAPMNYGYPDTTTDGPSVGGTGGNSQAPFTCPAGSAVNSIGGYNGRNAWPDELDRVQVQCNDRSMTQSPYYLNNDAAGTTPFVFSCPQGQVATGLGLNLVGNGSPSYAGFMTGISCVVL